MQGFFNSDLGDTQLKEGKATATIAMVVEDLMVPEYTPVADLVSNWGEKEAVSSAFNLLVNGEFGDSSVSCAKLKPRVIRFDVVTKFEEGDDYFKGTEHDFGPQTLATASSCSAVRSFQGSMSSQDYPAAQAGKNQKEKAAASEDSSGLDGLRMVASPSQGMVSNVPMAATDSSLLTKGKGTVGGPTGLFLASPNASIGFAATTTSPPTLRRNNKTKLRSPTMFNDKPIVIDMEAALRAVADKLVVGRVLSPYPADPQAVVNELKGPWRLRGEAAAQRVKSEDRRFVVTFSEEGDRRHVLQAGPWHYRNDAVLLAAFDGSGDPVDVPLDSFRI
ncbi:hypothetical protein VPH35_060814 [Triticum aestivum]|uniref:Uncharacterized protein n=1 Tax=Aegilops tauschii subsp. strangulata TaxID=200361 RepID=A0A453FIP2_AEGTS